MTNEIALVTGTSSGMGLHTAVGLAAAGHTVVATMRDTGRAQDLLAAAAAAGVMVQVAALEVTDQAAIDRVVSKVLAEHGRIDILINNAGQGSVGTLEQLELTEIRRQLEVNYVAVAALTKAVLPGMRAQRSGRVITVTSVGGAVGQPFADAYCGAKFAVEGLMQSLAPVMAEFGVHIGIVEPGAVASSFVSNAERTGGDPDDPYRELLDAYLRRSSGVFANAQTSADAAAVIIDAAIGANPVFRRQTTVTATGFVGLSLADADGSRVISQTAGWLR